MEVAGSSSFNRSLDFAICFIPGLNQRGCKEQVVMDIYNYFIQPNKFLFYGYGVRHILNTKNVNIKI